MIAAGCLGVAATASATPVQSSDSLRAAVESFLERQPAAAKGTRRIEVGAMDPRLQLPACDTPLQLTLPKGTRPFGNVTVSVRCEDSWSVYVPARVELHDNIAVLTRTLPRGAVIAAADVEWMDRDISSQPGGYYTSEDAVIGKALRRPAVAGTALDPTLLQEPRVVRRGDRVNLVVRTNGFEVRVEGEALEEGGRGDRVRARNLRSKREVQGTVTGPGTIEIVP